ncbi:sulfate adenylyltransferase, partial [Amycolatopsis sp. NPDC047767]
DDLDISRGDLIAVADRAPRVTDELTATLCWLSAKPLAPAARVLVKHGARTTPAVVTEITARFDEQSLLTVDAPATLELNDIGHASLRLAEPLAVDPYAVSPRTGSFLVIDPRDGDTLAAGVIT